jgi:hypothetical protein
MLTASSLLAVVLKYPPRKFQLESHPMIFLYPVAIVPAPKEISNRVCALAEHVVVSLLVVFSMPSAIANVVSVPVSSEITCVVAVMEYNFPVQSSPDPLLFRKESPTTHVAVLSGVVAVINIRASKHTGALAKTSPCTATVSPAVAVLQAFNRPADP